MPRSVKSVAAETLRPEDCPRNGPNMFTYIFSNGYLIFTCTLNVTRS